jgi:diaminohydroxyphosphoribosylaminopyrimidine deaminase / 5-amino-6-(5-phosphoribosylamino)uracil reductase
MASTEIDERFMRVALGEAKKGLGRTSPNPAVGAILATKNKVIARGHHRQAGGPHAEMECLGQVNRAAVARSTMYLTLEPCSTIGKTPPCTCEIIRARVKRVVIGAIDVNPRHAGRGITQLRAAGIEVETGVLSDECAALNEAFNKWIVTRQPFVIAKCGMSLDGRLTRPSGEPAWITNAAARRHAHKLRASVDAILVGAETVRADDPQLTVRGVRGARQPWRVVLTRSGKLPRNARLFTDRHRERTMIYRRQPLSFVLQDLGSKNVTSVLIEGGGEILGQALDAGLIDKAQIYIGSMLTGGPVIAFGGRGAPSTQEAARLERISYTRLGDNICVTGYPRFRAIT